MEDVFGVFFIWFNLYLTAAWQKAEPPEGEGAEHVSLERSMTEALKEMKESSLSFLWVIKIKTIRQGLTYMCVPISGILREEQSKSGNKD